MADGDNADSKRSQATALFGRGLNTAQAGNAVNHVVLPRVIKINAGGVVDFAVAEFHGIIIFKPGFTQEQLVQAGGGQFPLTPPRIVIPADPATPLPAAIAFLADSIYYRGISPAGGPLGTAVAGNPANGFNRTEPWRSSTLEPTSSSATSRPTCWTACTPTLRWITASTGLRARPRSRRAGSPLVSMRG